MSAADPAAPSVPEPVQVYGVDHSPWVQAVLLGLHEKGIASRVVIAPPLPVFRRSGVLMPAARLGDGDWRLDSERILVELGYSAVPEELRRELTTTFLTAALHRADHPWQFWHLFSFVGDEDPSLVRRCWRQFWRAFSMFYFFCLISASRLFVRRKATEDRIQELSRFQDRLDGSRPYFGGDAPDTVDLQLFGIVQMCASIPGPSLTVLREAPKLDRLRAWIQAMQSRFADYPHLYTAEIFEPKGRQIEPASMLERASYWSGAVLMWLALPVTLPLTFFLSWRIRTKGLLDS